MYGDSGYWEWDIQDVAQKLPNGFGLYDMHGNVHEWTSNYYVESFPLTSTDPEGASEGDLRVVRGGRYSNLPSQLDAAYRERQYQQQPMEGNGFRLVRRAP